MKAQTFLLAHVLLHSTRALSLPDDVHAALTPRTDSKKPSIEWSKCDLNFRDKAKNEAQKKFDCARFEVPLDYMNSSDGKTIKLDLIRAKATKEPSMGSVLYNPGGPGGSGVEAVLTGAEAMLPVLGGHYDIIGFDPRGTGRTIPFDCPTAEEILANAGNLHRREFHTLPQFDVWEDVKTEGWQMFRQVAQLCWEEHRDTGRFIGTPFVARDMMAIVDALGQGDKLNYWGSSYGTILGQVVASMFPKRVGRILLDANLNADDYLAGTWLTGTFDTERSLANLFNDCVMSGKDLCSLADYHGKSTTGESLMNEFRSKSEDVALSYQTKEQILQPLYNPIYFPTAIKAIEDLFTGKTPDNSTGGASGTKWNRQQDMALFGIACSDSTFRVEDPDDLFSVYQAHYAESSFADVTIKGRVGCASWKFSAAERTDLNTLRNVNTSYPILVVNGRYDPATSLRSAWEVSTKFRGSRVVVHEGAGHGLTAHPSNCTNNIVAKYFIDGEMPEVNTTCSADMTAFEYVDSLIKGSDEED
ncbi:uncharacterized protein FIESC28_02068 [Fusarium coffeatum]|uniref:Peptidase S33 tripeptidyl aminopeptidase-like C-terminal domain-containing protein n=1 Tax=Fusarium coffeatum TaxID=231269 RepID=A0A366S8Y4_9HYPO|nr:uncharacterized protein FIESC28_02068 [Fusarium coffeatum]RBR25160.1 hypothetical protein FIESC28_02068 [Fusarium coffeatum]